MKHNYYVFDDILSKEEQDVIYNYVKDETIRWEDLKNITGEYGGKKETHLFPAKVHPQMSCKNDSIRSLIDNIQIIVSKKLDLEFVKNYRWKINWTEPLNHEYNPMDLLHYDRITEHIAVVYYINDSTGDTHIYNNKFGNNAETYRGNFNKVDLNSYELLTKVSPKKGRCLVFDGRFAHHANYPISEDRFIINFNFAAKVKNEFKSLV